MNNLIIGIVIILSFSIVWDSYSIWRIQRMRNELENYVQFEKEAIDSAQSSVINQIKTSIAFKSPDRREKLFYLSGFEIWPMDILESQILKMHPDIKTLDSLPNSSDEISTPRSLLNNSKNQSIQEFYKELLTLSMLEVLAANVFDDSEFGFGDGRWAVVRPITGDSTYIGSKFNPDRRSKYAYNINGRYFEGQYKSRIFTIPKSDTINITTIGMNNAWTKIDTHFHKEQIVFNGIDWRAIGN